MAKKIIIVFVSFLILAGGTTAAMKWLNIGPFETNMGENEKKVKKKRKPVFVDLEPLLFNIIQGDKVSKPIQIQITLQTDGQANATFLKQRVTKLKAEFFEDLFSFIPRLLEKKDRLDVTILQDRLKVIGHRLVGKDYIENVQVQIEKDKKKR